jgi:hypothetical protein
MAFSKKARALAVEVSLDIEPSSQPLSLVFCNTAAAYLVLLDEHNINRAANKYWPTLILKKQLPPSQYRVLWKQANDNYALLGDISFP